MKARNIAFYKFVTISDPGELCARLKTLAQNLKVKGTILIASEGINGMVSGSELSVASFENQILRDSRFFDLQFKVSHSLGIPFRKLLVKVKPEILTLGLKDIKPSKETAQYISPEDLQRNLSQSEDLALIDVRNNFEYEHGTFEGAINPQTKSFREFKEFAENLTLDKNKKIVTFCTGGIRCEKGALLLKKAGFKNVFQLEGGILQYFSKVRNDTFFKGHCFVFDERELLNSKLEAQKINT